MYISNTKIEIQQEVNRNACKGCHSDIELGFDFEFAFQPIVNITDKSIFAHEALVRGPNGEGALTVLSQVTNNYKFDQACRIKAVKTASEINLEGYLSINFMPNAVYKPELCIQTTFEAAKKFNFDTKKIIFEFTEQELIEDIQHISNIMKAYSKMGFKTALDDFGAGYAGLNFIADCEVDIIKIDMGLIRDIDKSKSRQAIVKAVTRMCEDLNIRIIAEGIETIAERDVLESYGVTLFQGYLFCKPTFKANGVINDDSLI